MARDKIFRTKPTKNTQSIKEGVLIIYSCLQTNAFLQQNIVMVNQFINELKNKYNITILTSRDTFKLIMTKEINVVVDKITYKTITAVIRQHKIKKIIPMDCSLKIITRVMKNEAVQNLFTSFHQARKSAKMFQKQASSVGFLTIGNNDVANDGKYLCVTAIKDSFGNQIILDYIETKEQNGQTIFYSHITLNATIQHSLCDLIKKFGNLLTINNYPYMIKLRCTKNGEVMFDDIHYGLTCEMIYSLQRQQINLPKMIIHIYNQIPVYHHISRDIYTSTRNYTEGFKVNFEYGNATLQMMNGNFKSGVNKNKNVVCLENFNKIKKHNSNSLCVYGEFILVAFSEEFIFDINKQLLFCQTCNLLSRKANKKILLLTNNILPIFQLLDNHHCIVAETYNIKTLQRVLDNYSIQSAYIVQSACNTEILQWCKTKNIKILGFKNAKNAIQYINDDDVIDFCNNISVLCQPNRLDNHERLLCYCCVTDRYKNISTPTLTSCAFDGYLKTTCFLCPGETSNYNMNEIIDNIVLKIIDNINVYGIVSIVFIEKNSQLFVHKIIYNLDTLIFFMHSESIQKLINIFTDILLNNNTDKNVPHVDLLQKHFWKKICFQHLDKQVVKMEDLTIEKIKQHYARVFTKC